MSGQKRTRKRFRLVQDNSCHWYIIPEDKWDDWAEWSQIDPDDPAGWDAPSYAQGISGCPSNVTFENPEDFV